MKILYIVPDLVVGGVTTVVENISHSMKERGHDIYILTLKPNKLEYEDFFTIKMLKKTDIFNAVYRLHRIVLELKPDIIHSHTIYPNILILFYKLLFRSKIKIINTEHSLMSYEQSKSTAFLLYKRISRLADKVSFVSKASMSSYIENNLVSKDQSFLIYNGIKEVPSHLSDKLEVKFSEEKIRFCFIGRIAKEKNLELMVDAFTKLKSEYDNVELYIIGDGILKSNLKNIVKDKNVKDVFFLGFKKRVEDYIVKMDCILLSSLTESLPTVILEAYAKRKIVISTDVGGVNEIIKDKIFLPESNNPKAYLRSLEEFCNLNTDQRLMYEEKNYEIFLEKFTLEKMADNYEELYSKIISEL